MKILVISSTPWNIDNSFGNTYSNLFEGINNLEFANIYCSYGLPKNNIKGTYFQITEKRILKNLFNPKYNSGIIITKQNNPNQLSSKEYEILQNSKKLRWRVFFWFRSLIWKIGRWKSKELTEFIEKFNADIIFIPLYHSDYLNDIACYVKNKTKLKMVGYVSDDIYTLKQYSLDPFYWLDRLRIRKKIKKTVSSCEFLYVISEIQKKEYEEIFKKECKILIKGKDFYGPVETKACLNNPKKLVYTGNIGNNRWKTLSEIGAALHTLNQDIFKGQLVIYSTTPLTLKMEKAFNKYENSIIFKGGVSSEIIPSILADADILIHVESFDKKARLAVRHSFSTKIVDYLHIPRCIFAVGPYDVASIDYLINNDAAIVAYDEESLRTKLADLINNPQTIHDYALKAWECGKKHHQLDKIQRELHNDLKELI